MPGRVQAALERGDKVAATARDTDATFAERLPAYDDLRTAVAAYWSNVRSGDPSATGAAEAQGGAVAALACGRHAA
ncbi:hypothetical protein [Streptomyces sp. YU58]|uniref:hypothetical protein n=1 Tax=Streptomyces sp. SX92 TaxID=3158972 RepID=UPI0027B89CE4|nr:hypothetical protein [Streptomyces coralus]WLW53452.1 hypothetical protein QU709_19650 [Streptomyces coralus]